MKRKRIIIVIMPEYGLCREIVLGFNAAAVTYGWIIRVITSVQDHLLYALQDPDVQGVLVGPFLAKEVLLSNVGTQVTVAVVTYLPDRSIPSIRVDDAAIGRAAADHLLNQGQRDFAAFGWPEPFFLERERAFAQRVVDAGARFHGRWNQTNEPWLPANEKEAFENNIKQWVMKLPRPVAILAGTDGWGRQFNFMLYGWGIRVPEDIAVIGVDNDALVCETAVPPLSSVAVPWQQVGAEAARLMEAAFTSKEPRPVISPLVVVPPSGVVARRSSDMLAVQDSNVAAALRIIREQATGPLSVPDILRRVPIGRHALQRAFRKNVGRTILDELRRVRVERAKSLLVTTELSVPEVATRSGFSSAPKLSEMFRRETGTTPTSYRRKFRIG